MDSSQSQKTKTSLKTLVVSFWTFISRIFGVLRDIATTYILGAGVAHDVFVVMLKIPNLFRRLVAEGAFSQAFIPVFTEYKNNQSREELKKLIDLTFTAISSLVLVLCILFMIFAPIVVFIFAPGFYIDPAKKILAIEILRITFPYLFFVSLVAFFGAILNSFSLFSVPAATPIAFNLSIIIGAIFFTDYFQLPVLAIAWGVFAAGLIQFFINIIPILKLKLFPKLKLDFNHPGLKKISILMLPGILSGGIIQINILIDTIFASLLITGSPTWLYISDRLIQFPMGIFAIAIGTVLLPTLSKFDLNHEKDKFIAGIKKGQKFVLYIGLPSLIGLFFCAEDLISTIFYRGAFSSIDVINSSYSLMAFSFGLPFFMLMKVLTPAFFARKDTKTPMYVALASLFLNVIFNYYLAFVLDYGHVGIAIGSSLAAIISVLTLEIVLYRDGFIKSKSIINKFSFNLFISSLFLIIFLYFYTSEINFMKLTQFERIFYLSIEVFASVIIYFSI